MYLQHVAFPRAVPCRWPVRLLTNFGVVVYVNVSKYEVLLTACAGVFVSHPTGGTHDPHHSGVKGLLSFGRISCPGFAYASYYVSLEFCLKACITAFSTSLGSFGVCHALLISCNSSRAVW